MSLILESDVSLISGPGLPTSTALFSDDKVYRYRLDRRWGDADPLVIVMLNPSTADAHTDDPTVAKCVRYARRWGAGGLTVLNLFALRSTDPRALYQHPDPVGPANDQVITEVLGKDRHACVAAWGVHGAHLDRGRHVADLLRRHGAVHCLKTTKDGHPGHPLYLRDNALMVPFDGLPTPGSTR